MTLQHLVIVVGLSISSLATARTPPPSPSPAEPTATEPTATESTATTTEEPAATLASAEPTVAAGATEPSMVEKMTMGARNAARDGRCDTVAIIGKRVRVQDARYHAEVFAVDPVLVGCVQGRRVVQALFVTTHPSSITPAALPSLTARVDAPSVVHADDYKSPSTALALSLGVTGAGIVTAIVAGNVRDGDTAATLGITAAAMIVVGPTTGHIYAGNGWNTGLKWRLATFGIFVGAGVGVIATCPPLGGSCNDGAAAVLGIVATGAVFTHVGATLYELGTAGSSARAYNRKRDPDLAVAPMLGREPGIAVVGRF